MPSERFWELSMREIHSHIDSYHRRRKAEFKERIQGIFLLANQIGDVMSCVLSSKKQIPSQVWDHFPELFAEEKVEYEKKHKAAMMAQYKQERLAMAERYNKKFEKMGGDTSE